MMTPILNAAPNIPEAYYTEKQMSDRNVVERCIEIIKARFSTLDLDSEDLEIIEQERGERDDAARLMFDNRGSRRRPNYLLEQGRNYQVALVQRLWTSRQ